MARLDGPVWQASLVGQLGWTGGWGKKGRPHEQPPWTTSVFEGGKISEGIALFRFKQFEFWHSFFASLDDPVWQASLDGQVGRVEKGTSGWGKKGKTP